MEENCYNYMVDLVKNLSNQASYLLGTSLVESSLEHDYNQKKKSTKIKRKESMDRTPEEVLKSVFGYDSFRPMQREVIQNVLDGRDTVAVMPTGGGKSICYQVPALLLSGITLVISPLISLMQDQVYQLESLGIPSAFLNSSLEWADYLDTCDLIRRGKIKLLYISPEGLNTHRMLDLLQNENVHVDCITIDEAHCISEWGHDFRPDYMEISNARKMFPKAVCLALTATATTFVQNDIARLLNMEEPAILVSSFNRPNLYMEVRRKNNSVAQVMEFLNQHKGQSGIIYCMSRKHVDQLYELLRQNNFSVLNYHAGLSDNVRTNNQKDFIQGRVDIMVATVAFGMGINKPDVRFVVHFDLPKSIEQYYQEIGRAGRDGLNAYALLLYNSGDIHRIKYLFQEKVDSSKDERLLQAMVNYAETHSCRRQFLLSYFGEHYDPNSIENPEICCCDCCSRGDVTYDMTLHSQKYMSCVIRTKQRYGAAYVIDVLMGSKSQRVMDNGDNNLSTWGIGKDLSRHDWFELNSCLLDAGYLQKEDEYNTISVTNLGYQMLRERRQIMLPVQLPSKKYTNERRQKKASGYLLDENDEVGISIAEDLRNWRRNLAEEIKIPPYAIFNDRTMLDIAVKKPKNTDELLDCIGIGETKAAKYGEAILKIVDDNL